MADLAGKLNIELEREGEVLKVGIRSSRPVTASRVFVGKGVDETAAALPALFSICATAQSCACATACEAALGVPPNAELAHARLLLVDAETIREHLWRLLLDWPRFLGEEAQAPAMARAMAAFNRMREALAGGADLFRPGKGPATLDFSCVAQYLDELAAVTSEFVLGAPSQQWLSEVKTVDDLLAWSLDAETRPARLLRAVAEQGWSACGRSRVAALPPLPAAELERQLGGADADAFVALPEWQGAPAETSPYSRNLGNAVVTGLTARFGNGLFPRLAAQLVELARLQNALRDGFADSPTEIPPIAASMGEGVGIAQVQAARGLLVHRVVIEGDRIRDYRILAPTEWNFHPQGCVARGLADLGPAENETLRRQAGLFVTAVDPCVDYDVTIR